MAYYRRRRRILEAKHSGVRIEDLPPELQKAAREFLFLQEQYDRVRRMFEDLKDKRAELAEPLFEVLEELGERNIIIEDAMKRLRVIETPRLRKAEMIIDKAVEFLEEYNEAQAEIIRQMKEAHTYTTKHFRAYKIKVEEGLFDAMAKLYKWLAAKVKAAWKWLTKADRAAEGFLDAVEDIEAMA